MKCPKCNIPIFIHFYPWERCPVSYGVCCLCGENRLTNAHDRLIDLKVDVIPPQYTITPEGGYFCMTQVVIDYGSSFITIMDDGKLKH